MNLSKLSKEIHETAVEKGFWDEERNRGEAFKLINCELSECCEAHREDLWADVQKFEKYLHTYQGDDIDEDVAYANCFKKYIKDTVEDELADAFIRCLDWLYHEFGGTHLPVVPETVRKESDLEYTDNFAEGLFNIEKQVCRENILVAAAMIQEFCDDHDVDLEWHVKGKMKFNENREKMHGKKY